MNKNQVTQEKKNNLSIECTHFFSLLQLNTFFEYLYFTNDIKVFDVSNRPSVLKCRTLKNDPDLTLASVTKHAS